MIKDINSLVRRCIAALTPYSTARDEYKGDLGVFLDANESPYENGYNRYPDPHQKALKAQIAAIKGVKAENIFIGNYSPESAGDYASGTNHTLPTSGWAHSCSGVNIDSFMRKMTIQELSREGIEALAPTIVAMADAEGLEAHANAVKVRIAKG